MSLDALNQVDRLDLRGAKPLLLVDIDLGDATLHFAQRFFRYQYGSQSILYDPYIHEISGLGDTLEIFGSGSNSSGPSITLRNDPWDVYSKLIHLDFNKPFTGAIVSVYEILLVSDDETFSSDVRVLRWKGAVQRKEKVGRDFFTLACCPRILAKRNGYGQKKVTKELFPYADPNDVGSYINIPYGDLEFVPCKCIRSGAVDLLLHSVTTAQTTIELSGIAQIDWDTAGVVQIDDELIVYTGRILSDDRVTALTGCTRGAGGTNATTHNSATPVFQVLQQLIYIASQVPVKAITAVYVENVRQTDNYRAFTGQPGDEASGFEGMAVIVFTVRPVVKKQVNIDVEEEHDHASDTQSYTAAQTYTATSQGLHDHSTSAIVQYEAHPVGVTSAKNVTNGMSAGDGNPSTYAHLYSASEQSYCWWGFDGSGYGTVAKVEVNITMSVSGGNAYAAGILIPSGSSGTFKITSPGNIPWGGPFGVVTAGPGVDVLVFEIFAKYFYWPDIAASPATGVGSNSSTAANTASATATQATTSTILGGLSVADIVVGGEVTCDLLGATDDDLGTISGTPRLLLERPDLQIKHILVKRFGFSLSDIGASFANSAAFYANYSYKMAFLMHDVATDSAKFFAELAKQCRSVFYECAGKFELKVLPDSSPAPEIELRADELASLPEWDFTGTDEIANRTHVYYRRDYRGNTGNADTVVGISRDARAKGYIETLSLAQGSADLEEDILLSAVRIRSVATDVLAYWHNFRRVPRGSTSIDGAGRARLCGLGSFIGISDDTFGPVTLFVTQYFPDFGGLGKTRLSCVPLDDLVYPDDIAPVVTGFSLQARVEDTLSVVIIEFLANDNVGITGYYVSESTSTPDINAVGWSKSPQTLHDFASGGSKTLYGWARDAAGNISQRASATVSINIEAPRITFFEIPATYTENQIPITRFEATDNVGVTGYLVTLSADIPSLSDPGWSIAPPESRNVPASGSITLYAWARDAMGNISACASDSVTVTLPTGFGTVGFGEHYFGWSDAIPSAGFGFGFGISPFGQDDFGALTDYEYAISTYGADVLAAFGPDLEAFVNDTWPGYGF